jgi:surface antigen
MTAGGERASVWGVWTKIRFSKRLLALLVILTVTFGHHAALADPSPIIHSTAHHSIKHARLTSSLRYSTHSQYLASERHENRYRLVNYRSQRHHYLHYASARYHYSRLQCVPYAREVSHIQLSGDAFLWWAEASGRYSRGSTPVEGAVLNFRSIRRMPLGHVAVVTSVIDNRTILVTQANWIRGTITNDVTMQDVSPNNDWTQVEVELGDSSRWGAAYPTYGFIYNQPADSTIIASTNSQGNEVAEAPRASPITTDAPDRNLQ